MSSELQAVSAEMDQLVGHVRAAFEMLNGRLVERDQNVRAAFTYIAEHYEERDRQIRQINQNIEEIVSKTTSGYSELFLQQKERLQSVVDQIDVLNKRVESLGSTCDKLTSVGNRTTQLEGRLTKLEELEERLIRMEEVHAKTTKNVTDFYDRVDGFDVQQQQQYLELTKKIHSIDDGVTQLRDEFYEKESQGGSFASPAHSEAGPQEAEVRVETGNDATRKRLEARPDCGPDVGVSRVSEATKVPPNPQGAPKEWYPLGEQVPQPVVRQDAVPIPVVPKSQPIPQIPTAGGRGHPISVDLTDPPILPPQRPERESGISALPPQPLPPRQDSRAGMGITAATMAVVERKDEWRSFEFAPLQLPEEAP